MTTAGLSGPDITRNGSNNLTLLYSESYSDAGASAVDVYGNTLSVNTSIPNGLSNGNPGTYIVTYSATDQFGNTLAFINAPDFETTQDANNDGLFVVKIKATDGSNNSTETRLEITINDLNETPTAPSLSQLTIAENTTNVGTLSATDPDNDSLTYTLGDTNDGHHFSISGNTLSFISPPDFEAPTDNDTANSYRVKIIASDGSLDSGEILFIINVTDADEPAIEEFRSTYGLAADGSEDSADRSGNGVANIHYLAFDLGDPAEANVDRSRLPIFEDGPYP